MLTEVQKDSRKLFLKEIAKGMDIINKAITDYKVPDPDKHIVFSWNYNTERAMVVIDSNYLVPSDK